MSLLHRSLLLFLLAIILANVYADRVSPIVITQQTNGVMKYNDALQASCYMTQGSLKIATNKADLLLPTPGGCTSSWPNFFVPPGYSTSIQVTTTNPTGDDTYSVVAYYFPNSQYVNSQCELHTPSCSYPFPCQPPGQTKNTHLDIFNATSCGFNSAAVVQFECLATPGAFNDHCEIDYTIGFCGTNFVNTTAVFPAQCDY